MRIASWLCLLSSSLSGCLCSAILELGARPDDRGGADAEADTDAGDAGDASSPTDCASNQECDDGVECTDDVCTIERTCVNTARSELCESDEICVPSTGGCVPQRPCLSEADCPRPDACTSSWTCERSSCVPGSPTKCANDGDACNGPERCDPVLGCVSDQPLYCNDNVDCTDDSCEGGSCSHVPDHGRCSDGKWCNGSELCDESRGCVTGPPMCEDDEVLCSQTQCIESKSQCQVIGRHDLCPPGLLCAEDEDSGWGCREVSCAEIDNCDDGDLCNGLEVCDAETSTCQPGQAIPCDDGLFCNGAEYCADGECRNQDPPSCSDGIGCTTDVCDPLSDACVNTPQNVLCDDFDACDGLEQCVVGTGCRGGAPLECDDGNDCTADRCDTDSGCLSPLRDGDGDGHGDALCGGADCDDTNPSISPEAPESCNGRDDNCDGEADEVFDCALGAGLGCTTTCGTAGLGTCTDECELPVDCEPPPEDCNGVDDNCDTQVDEGCGCSPNDDPSCPTICDTRGRRSCVQGNWTPCEPPAESCNGRDDDCDGQPDNGFACIPGRIGVCTTDCRSSGSRVCGNDCNWGPCQPPAETCNGSDDDCDADAEPDNGLACVQNSTMPCVLRCGATGELTCSTTCEPGACEALPELCNGADDNCDGFCDEGFDCCRGSVLGQCVTGCNTLGSEVCADDCNDPGNTCTASVEVCNGRDDDCDSEVDEGFACSSGARRVCVIGGRVSGYQVCGNGCNWGPCCAVTEQCFNGIDDDCDGSVDEFGCCSANVAVDTCGRIVDEDCNGLCDDDAACCKNEMVSCLTTCNTIGSQKCNGNCTLLDCAPPPEVTNNGIDDDCDGLVDEPP